ncbi:hypothetical protein RJ641_003226 [Dillenia turbinata]|uniref:mannan endo-1,4-beta-mannosidase n=1 Tax=Dillenia turbinata TaxID=194707 RepID=A0AAN8VAM5_9MAGN
MSDAKKYKIRLFLSLVNNWEQYGGKPQYVKWGQAVGFNSWIQEMAVYVKSMDPKHLVEIGLEGFYGPSTPNKYLFNPSTYYQQIGTDFIRNHQIVGVDFASVHMYLEWLSETISDAHIQFIKSWMQAHIDDAEKVLGMPVLFGEFGLSTKNPGYNSSLRDTLFSTIYRTILGSTKKGGSGARSLFWQLFLDGMDEWPGDGMVIVLSKSPSTACLISIHSSRLILFNSMCTWNCKWGCKKKHALEEFLFHNDL